MLWIKQINKCYAKKQKKFSKFLINFLKGKRIINDFENKEITIDKKDFRLLILGTFRYSLERMTYMPIFVKDTVLKHIDDLDEGSIEIMIEEIESRKHYGMDFDKEIRLDLKDKLEEYLIEKNKKRG